LEQTLFVRRQKLAKITNHRGKLWKSICAQDNGMLEGGVAEPGYLDRGVAEPGATKMGVRDAGS
jgi:hypothetical protein